MDLRQSLVSMLERLLQDVQMNQHLGSGYYSCIPLARRYNKLLEQARNLFSGDNALIGTFETIAETEPKDPSDKMKVLQSVQIETGQLITLLESARGSDAP
jgi:hypothetical protein